MVISAGLKGLHEWPDDDHFPTEPQQHTGLSTLAGDNTAPIPSSQSSAYPGSAAGASFKLSTLSANPPSELGTPFTLARAPLHRTPYSGRWPEQPQSFERAKPGEGSARSKMQGGTDGHASSSPKQPTVLQPSTADQPGSRGRVRTGVNESTSISQASSAGNGSRRTGPAIHGRSPPRSQSPTIQTPAIHGQSQPPYFQYHRSATLPPSGQVSPTYTSGSYPHIHYSPHQHAQLQHQQVVSYSNPYGFSQPQHVPPAPHPTGPFPSYQQPFTHLSNTTPDISLSAPSSASYGVDPRGIYPHGHYPPPNGENPAAHPVYSSPTPSAQLASGLGIGHSSSPYPPSQFLHGSALSHSLTGHQLSGPYHSSPPQITVQSSMQHNSSAYSPTSYPVHSNSSAVLPAFASFPSTPPGYAHIGSPPPTSFPQHPVSMYPQHFATQSSGHSPTQQPAMEGQPQGTWWYLPSNPVQPQIATQYELHGPYSAPFLPAQGSPSVGTPQAGIPLGAPSVSTTPRQRFPHTHTPRQAAVAGTVASGRAGSSSLNPTRGGGSASISQGSPNARPASHDARDISGPTPPQQQEARHDTAASRDDPDRSSASPGQKKQDSPTRKPYHPSAPTHRSEWVMWVGNVPSNSTHDELWKFFSHPVAQTYHDQSPSPNSPAITPPDSAGGVSSVFLISQSNCAFINFNNEKALQQAIEIFNGRPLRPKDPKCPRLVCRVRKKDDDLRAGVGGQRGMGIHTRWVKNQVEGEQSSSAGTSKHGQLSSPASGGLVAHSRTPVHPPSQLVSPDDPPTSPSTHLAPSSASEASPSIVAQTIPSIQPPDPGFETLVNPPKGRRKEKMPGTSSNSTDSFASTTSSFLLQHFPIRYFILKSLTEYELNLSVERGLWATQPHNEPVLDQAFRTSKEVYLVFSANKSGGFFGYAKMEGPILKGEKRLSWSSHTGSSSSKSVGSSSMCHPPSHPTIQEDVAGEQGQEPLTTSSSLFSNTSDSLAPGTFLGVRVFAASPSQITPSERREFTVALEQVRRGEGGVLPDAVLREPNTAPAELGPRYKRVTYDSPTAPNTFDEAALRVRQPRFTLNPEAPFQAQRDRNPKPVMEEALELEQKHIVTSELVPHPHILDHSPDQVVGSTEQHKQDITLGDDLKSETWGIPFKIKWIKTERLPFHRTKHLRNKWNYDREVKVSRDGTEIDPVTGDALLKEWDRRKTPPGTPSPIQPKQVSARPRGGPSAAGRGRGSSSRPSIYPSATWAP